MKKNEFRLNTINIFDITFLVLLYLKLTNQVQLDWIYIFAPICVSLFGYIFVGLLSISNKNKNNIDN